MVYDTIKKLADKKGMTIREVEVKSNLGNGVIGKWRRSSPRLSNLISVADTLGVPVTRLLKE